MQCCVAAFTNIMNHFWQRPKDVILELFLDYVYGADTVGLTSERFGLSFEVGSNKDGEKRGSQRVLSLCTSTYKEILDRIQSCGAHACSILEDSQDALVPPTPSEHENTG